MLYILYVSRCCCAHRMNDIVHSLSMKLTLCVFICIGLASRHQEQEGPWLLSISLLRRYFTTPPHPHLTELVLFCYMLFGLWPPEDGWVQGHQLIQSRPPRWQSGHRSLPEEATSHKCQVPLHPLIIDSTPSAGQRQYIGRCNTFIGTVSPSFSLRTYLQVSGVVSFLVIV